MAELSPKIKQKNADKWLQALTQELLPGETVWALFGRGRVKPLTNAIALTNARVLGFYADGRTSDKRIPLVVLGDQIRGVDFREKMGTINLVIPTDAGEVVLGAVDKSEVDFARYYINFLSQHGIDPAVTAGMQRQSEEAAAAHRAGQERVAKRDAIEVFGSAMKDKWWAAADAHAHDGELPWFIINGGMDGRLFAFEDRLVISKTGGMTGFMAGATGGGRETVFHYADITNIEYNSGFVNGVLEVLTPSYQGTSNHDFWNSNRNGGSSPHELSNCLPLPKALYQQAQPRIKELQQKVVEAKRPQVVVQHVAPSAPASSGGGLADELSKLADMHQRGLLDDDEFKAAKQAAIAKLS